jgi:hypothetical protein
LWHIVSGAEPLPKTRKSPTGPAGTAILRSKDGLQIIRSKCGRRWTAEAESCFIDHLAASCNVSAAAEACGFTRVAIYKRRRTDPAFAQRWQAALEQGAVRIEALLLLRAEEALEGCAPDPGLPIPAMSIKDALAILGHHRRAVERGPRSRRQWARPRSLDELSESILRKLEVIAPARSALPVPE